MKKLNISRSAQRKNWLRFQEAIAEVLLKRCPLCAHNDSCQRPHHGTIQRDGNSCLYFEPLPFDVGSKKFIERVFPEYKEKIYG